MSHKLVTYITGLYINDLKYNFFLFLLYIRLRILDMNSELVKDHGSDGRVDNKFDLPAYILKTIIGKDHIFSLFLTNGNGH